MNSLQDSNNVTLQKNYCEADSQLVFKIVNSHNESFAQRTYALL